MSTAKPSRPSILRTKLHRPQGSPDLLARPRLLELLGAGAGRVLTLVSAPAGYGKSVLVAGWAESRTEPTAWLSLDEEDRVLATFLSGVVASLRTILPEACPELETLLRSPDLPSSLAARTFLNELDAIERPFTLVLDDYHRLGSAPEIDDLLALLLDHPPRNLHLVIVTRCDPALPLASLLAQGRMIDVRADELRFTGSEVRGLFDTCGRRDIDDQALDNLNRQVEGWAVGLRLALLAVRCAADGATFLKSLSGGFSTVQDYLVSEVLEGLEPELRDWILRASILERFCPELCEAIRPSSATSAPLRMDGRAFCQELRARALFSIALGPDGQWSRFHHQFQDLCRIELERRSTAAEIAELHLLASAWFADQGLIEDAILFAVRAGDPERAAGLVEEHRQKYLNSDRCFMLERWLSHLPEALIAERPELLLGRAWALFFGMKLDPLPALMDEVEVLLAGEKADRLLLGEAALFRGYFELFSGNGAASRVHLEYAVEHTPPDRIEVRAEAELHHALAIQMEQGLAAARAVLDPRLEALDTYPAIRQTRLVAARAFADIIGGELTDALSIAKLLGAIADRKNYPYAAAWSYYLQGIVHCMRFDLERAEAPLRAAIDRRHQLHRRASADAMAVMVQVLEGLGRTSEADVELERLAEFSRIHTDLSLVALANSCERRLAVRRGTSVSGPPVSATGSCEEAMIFWFEVPELTDCRVLVARSTPKSLEEAERRLRVSLDWNTRQHNVQHLVTTLVLLAVACERGGRRPEALEFLERALVLAAPGDVALPFVEPGSPIEELLAAARTTDETRPFVRRLLATCGVGKVLTPQGTAGTGGGSSIGVGRGALLPEPLTDREQEVLELLAARFQNKEIAQRLHISVHTVNDHLKHLYGKLAVHGRREAVERARALGLAARPPA